jgi:hypothetical protein
MSYSVSRAVDGIDKEISGSRRAAVPAPEPETDMLTGKQIRAARVLLEWTAEYLANKAEVGLATLKRLEADQSTLRSTKRQVIQTLEAAGVEFIDANGVGVILRLAPNNRVKGDTQ